MLGRLKKAERTTFVIIAGCAGAGKTTVGKAVSEKMKWTYIDKDTVTRQYTDFILCASGSNEGDRESEFYCEKIRPIEYDVTLKLCRENLELGNSVVLTIPMIAVVQDFNKFSEMINKQYLDRIGVVVKFVWINHDENLEYARVSRRNASRDRYKLANWYEYSSLIADIAPDSAFCAYIFYNEVDRNLNEEVDKLIKWIQK